MFMAYNSQQKTENLARVQEFLNDIGVYFVDEETANIYGQFKAEIINHFGPYELPEVSAIYYVLVNGHNQSGSVVEFGWIGYQTQDTLQQQHGRRSSYRFANAIAPPKKSPPF